MDNDSTKYNDQKMNLLYIENIPRTYSTLHSFVVERTIFKTFSL